MTNLNCTSKTIEDALNIVSKAIPNKIDKSIASKVCEMLKADNPDINNDVTSTPPTKRIGRPKGSKNKPKRGRPRTRKVKRKIPPQPTISPQPPKILKNWERYLVRVNDTICENKPLLTIEDRLLVSAGGIITISGKPKSYKTFFTSAIIGAFINGKYMGISSHNKGEHTTVLLCDTEQGRARTQIVAKRVQQICGMTTQVFNRQMRTISVREISANERSKVLTEAIYDYKPKLVVLDGVRDLINDFNNIQESAEVVSRLMKAASEVDCAIVVVIHLNKGDDNIRGHLGSELCNKSETVIRLKSESDGTITVSPIHCRDIEFKTFAFRISNTGLPIPCNVAPQSAEDKADHKLRELEELAITVFDEREYMSRKEVCDAIVFATKLSSKTAGRRISEMINSEVIQLNPDNTYSIINQ